MVSRPAAPVLEVRDLRTHFHTRRGTVRAVDGVSYAVGAGRTLGVVGESGCGKSVSALSILRLVPDPPGRIVGGSAPVRGRGPARLPTDRMRRIRGNKISMIFQEPMTSLNPLLRIGDQISEPIMLHQGLTRKAALDKAVDMLRLVHIPDAEPVAAGLPAPDVRRHAPAGDDRDGAGVQPAGPARRRADHRARRHDPGPDHAPDRRTAGKARHRRRADHARSGRGRRDRAAGRGHVCGQEGGGGGRRSAVRPAAPSVHARNASRPRRARPGPTGRRRLKEIPGIVPSLDRLPEGCAFAPRCAYATERCWRTAPPLEEKASDHWAACWESARVVDEADAAF